MNETNSSRRMSRATFADVCTLESFFRHKWLAIMIFVIGLSITAAILFGRDRSYDSVARIFVRLGRESVADATTAMTGQSIQANDTQRREIQSVLDILRSNSMAASVVSQLGPDHILDYSEESTEDEPSAFARGLQSTLQALKGYLAAAKLIDPVNKRAKAVEALGKQVKSNAEEHSNVVSLRIRSESPKLSQEIATLILERFNEVHREAHRVPGAYSFFVTQLDSVREQLDSCTSKLRDVKNAAGFSSIEDQKLILAERLKGVDLAILESVSDVKGLEAKVEGMQMALENLPERIMSSEVTGLTNTSRDEMRDSLYKLEVEFADLATKFTDENPQLRRKKKQLDDAMQLFDGENLVSQKTTAVNTFHQEVKVKYLLAKADGAEAEARVKELERQRAGVMSEIRETNHRQVEIQTLEREQGVLEDNYKRYFESLEQARIDEALHRDNLSSINVIQPPTFDDDPVDISNTLVAIMGVVGSLLVGVGAAFGKRYLQNDLAFPEDVERELGIPVLVTIPASRRNAMQYQ